MPDFLLYNRPIFREEVIATPEESAYIEALHSNVQRPVVERYEFESICHAQMIFTRYYDWYNNHRMHGALKRKSPEQFLQQLNQESIPLKTEKTPILSQILNPFCPRIKGSIQQ